MEIPRLEINNSNSLFSIKLQFTEYSENYVENSEPKQDSSKISMSQK